MRWEHESKALQSAVWIGSNLFAVWNVPKKIGFGLPFTLLMDTLNVFASSASCQLDLRYPGPDAELVLEADEADSQEIGSGQHQVPLGSVYARIDTLQVPLARDLADYWEDPSSYFIAQGALLKEAIEDLDWTKGEVTVDLLRDPRKLKLKSSKGAQSLEIEIPQEALSGFSASGARVHWTYKQKHLRIAFANLPKEKDSPTVLSKVAIDVRGIMKVTHMLSLHAATMDPVHHPVASLDTQGTDSGAGASRLGVVQFLLLPHDETPDYEDDEEGEEGTRAPVLLDKSPYI